MRLSIIPLAASVFVFAAVPGLGVSGQATEAASENVVQLPPLLVEDINQGIPWVYVEDGSRRVIGRCDTSTANDFLRGLERAKSVFDSLVPKNFQGAYQLPDVYVLYSQRMKTMLPPQLLEEAYKRGAERKEASERPGALVVPNLRLADKDNAISFVYINEDKPTETLFFTSNFLRQILLLRTPQLPDWFMEGFVQVYENTTLYPDSYVLERLKWLSKEHTEALWADPEFPRALLPMDELFTPSKYPGPKSAEERRRLWSAQTALFVRWALSGDSERLEAFWNYVDRSSREPSSEALFRECFGFGYSDARDRLCDFLPRAIRQPAVGKPVVWQPPKIPDARLATEEEIVAYKGDWERQVVLYVRRTSPTFETRYADQARKTLGAAALAKKAEPRAKNALALLEFEAGNDAVARKLFEELIADGQARPRVFLELGRLRLRHAQEYPNGAEGRISREQVSQILEPLEALRGRQPAMSETYLVYAAALFEGEGIPEEAQFQVLEEGLRLFPKSGPLAILSACLRFRQGNTVAAQATVERGLKWCSEPKRRETLEKLRIGAVVPQKKEMPLEEPTSPTAEHP